MAFGTLLERFVSSGAAQGRVNSPVGGLGEKIKEVMDKAAASGLLQRKQMHEAAMQENQQNFLSGESSLERGSREDIASQNRNANFLTAGLDRASREDLGYAGLASNEGIAGLKEFGLDKRLGITERGLDRRQLVSEGGMDRRQLVTEGGLNTRQQVSEGGLDKRLGITEFGLNSRQDKQLGSNEKIATMQSANAYDPIKAEQRALFNVAKYKKDQGLPLTDEEQGVYNKGIGYDPVDTLKGTELRNEINTKQEAFSQLRFFDEVRGTVAGFKNALDTGAVSESEIEADRAEYFAQLIQAAPTKEAAAVLQRIATLPVDAAEEESQKHIYGYLTSMFPEQGKEAALTSNPNVYKAGAGTGFGF